MWTLLQSAMTKNVPFAKVPERSKCRYDSYVLQCVCVSNCTKMSDERM